MIKEEKEGAEEPAESRPLYKNQKKYPSVGNHQTYNPNMLGSTQNLPNTKTSGTIIPPINIPLPDSMTEKNAAIEEHIDTPSSFKKKGGLNKDKLTFGNEVKQQNGSSNVDYEKISDGI